ncbi:MAG: arginine--tRNA ligase [Candidatus Harrisonbacteria bacterium CG10_big_fil_rev_8_21_14_0_10_44_23]|uniref:Arginine--tRNA ligase n=1 Tax=Candidatus Harrisonbacteria bacterium CG10_big_fil_rev_8_21_14_0_10_44_23 TaxID=1974585 RepID=A0A2H0UQF2_9BACT|nr:MAG: arginine--tRNA ligase [Candidatus Harrisonbacteria bacterium CG10_big_fil_rev_8_21_14_0_10_44_23]
MTIQHRVKEFIQAVTLNTVDFKLEVPTQASFGHYSTNLALVLAKKEGKSSLEVAKELVDKLEKADDGKLFKKIEVAGPGFVNFWLNPEVLATEFKKFNPEKLPKSGNKEKVIIEFSSPNIAKPMHVGHLRSTIIGDSLARIYEALNFRVIRWNYLGDWGTQFGKLIAAYKKWGSEESLEKDPINHLLQLYVRFTKEIEGDKDLEQLGRDEFKKLEDGNKENRKLWKKFRQLSLREFAKTYSNLGIKKFKIEKGESDYQKNLPGVVKELKEKNIAKKSEGALIIELKDLPPALIQKSDGASLYFTREIAALEDRSAQAQKIFYVVGNEQSLHFQQLQAVSELIKLPIKIEHIKYGLVLNEEGKKISTRKGEAIQLSELLDKAVEKAKIIVSKKNPSLKEDQINSIANAVGIGAIKFNDLKENRVSDIRFDWDKMLDINGDSGPYLQYTYARLNSILQKGGKQANNAEELKENMEISIVKKLLDFPDVVMLCQESNLTSHLAKHLLDLAHTLNSYYESVPVLSAPKDKKSARLYLVKKANQVLEAGLCLLGIDTPGQI